MPIRAKFQALNLNQGSLGREISEFLEEVTREGVGVFVQVALDIITVWSSASHHTFQEAAKIAGQTIAATPVAGAPDRSGLGAASGTAELEVDEEGITFTYETSLFYLNINEVVQTFARNTPYNFRTVAIQFAQDYIIQRVEEEFAGLLADNVTVRRV